MSVEKDTRYVVNVADGGKIVEIVEEGGLDGEGAVEAVLKVMLPYVPKLAEALKLAHGLAVTGYSEATLVVKAPAMKAPPLPATLPPKVGQSAGEAMQSDGFPKKPV